MDMLSMNMKLVGLMDLGISLDEEKHHEIYKVYNNNYIKWYCYC